MCRGDPCGRPGKENNPAGSLPVHWRDYTENTLMAFNFRFFLFFEKPAGTHIIL